MATKAELMGLPEDLEQRLYERWKETRWGRLEAGIYDAWPHVEGEPIYEAGSDIPKEVQVTNTTLQCILLLGDDSRCHTS